MSDTDLQLLKRYARQHAEDDFAELVRRHLDLVFCAALRQVRSVQLAEDVAQSVFTDLSRNAEKLKPNTILTAWLYQVTTRTAIDVVRREARRTLREQVAVELTSMNATAADWTAVEPLLDEAMNTLDDGDRTAVLLRYFENKSFREVGEMLSTTEEAARKRLSRAIDRLREFFSKRGVTVEAGGLAALISANSVQAAPAGLAAIITTAALSGTAITTAAVIDATKAIAMTTLQKTVIAATVAILAGTGIYEVRQAANSRAEVQSLQQQQALLVEQMRKERDVVTNRLAELLAENEQLKTKATTTELLRLRGEVGRLRTDANNPTDATAKALVAKVNKLKQRLDETPNAKIPELQFLTEQDWLNAANGRLDTDVDYRRALAALRSYGEAKFAAMLQPALSQYMRANSGQFPTDLAQLQPYFTSPVDDAILQRWEITSPKTVPNLGMGKEGLITQKAPVDDVFDSRVGVGSSGYGTVDFLTTLTQDLLAPIYKAFVTANSGQNPSDLSQLLPYATTPEQQAAVEKMILRSSSTK